MQFKQRNRRLLRGAYLIFIILVCSSVSATIWDPPSWSSLKDAFVTYSNWGRNVDGSGYNISADNYLNASGDLEWIKPENVFDIDKEDIESDLNTFVDIAGDTMTGDLKVIGNANITNITTDSITADEGILEIGSYVDLGSNFLITTGGLKGGEVRADLPPSSPQVLMRSSGMDADLYFADEIYYFVDYLRFNWNLTSRNFTISKHNDGKAGSDNPWFIFDGGKTEFIHSSSINGFDTLFTGDVWLDKNVHIGDIHLNGSNNQITTTGDITATGTITSEFLNITNTSYLYNIINTNWVNSTFFNGTFYGDGSNLIISTTYNASLISTIAGTLDMGDLASIQNPEDGNSYNVTEDTGVYPVLTIDINFTNVTDFNFVVGKIWYEGGRGHTVQLEIWRCDLETWENQEEYTDMTDFVNIHVPILDPVNHICNGNVSLRFDHESSGLPAHVFRIDYLALVDGFTVLTASKHDGLSGRDNKENHPWVDKHIDNATIIRNTNTSWIYISAPHTNRTDADIASAVQNATILRNGTDANFGDLDVTGKITTEDLTLTVNSEQDYLFTERVHMLGIQGQGAGENAGLEIFSKDGDGTDSNQIILWNQGSPASVANSDGIQFQNTPTTGVLRTFKIGTGTAKTLNINSATGIVNFNDNELRFGIAKISTMKSGPTQLAAGAAANELWKTAGHDSLPDNVVMIGT